MAGVHVIHHWRQIVTDYPQESSARSDLKRPEILAITASTGGPAALSEIFKGLPDDFALPIVVVQHISPEFLPSLIEWLGTMTSMSVKTAVAGTRPQPRHIYFAPGDAHLRLTVNRRFELDRLTKAPYTPSGDILLNSVSFAYGSNAMGVVLTGMGSDGARGLRAMNNAGAYTIAQDEATSVVFGMPQEAIAMNGVNAVLPIQEIARVIVSLNSDNSEIPPTYLL
jgi:two-component system chemotaxis response regulator CheB